MTCNYERLVIQNEEKVATWAQYVCNNIKQHNLWSSNIK